MNYPGHLSKNIFAELFLAHFPYEAMGNLKPLDGIFSEVLPQQIPRQSFGTNRYPKGLIKAPPYGFRLKIRAGEIFGPDTEVIVKQILTGWTEKISHCDDPYQLSAWISSVFLSTQ